MTAPSFTQWLRAHVRRDTRLGDLARDVARDPCWPAGVSTWSEVREHLEHHGASADAVETARDALSAWARETGAVSTGQPR